MSLETLLMLSAGLNRSTLERLSSHQDPELESFAWAETQKEINAGWSWLAHDHDTQGLLIAWRFALRQGPTKIR